MAKPTNYNFEKELDKSVKEIKDRKAREKLEDEKLWKEFKGGFIVLFQLFLLTFLKFAEKAITAISYVFPFSFLLRNNRFHHYRKPFMDTWNELIETNRKSKTNFHIKSAYEDQYFYNYVGEFEGDNSKKNIENYIKTLKDKYKGNVFMQNYGQGLKNIKIIRDVVTS